MRVDQQGKNDMIKFILNGATILFCLIVIAGAGVYSLQAKPDNTLTPAEIVAKHLDSIGSAETRAGVQSIVARGSSRVILRLGGEGQATGQVVIASQGHMNLINMAFDSADYPSERIAFDGKNMYSSQIRPAVPTRLAQFLLREDGIFREGLIGGTLSAAWPLLNISDRNPKLEYAGLKKIGDSQCHMLRYIPRKGSDLKITLFFDAETFQHVRTEYEKTYAASMPRRMAPRVGATEQNGMATDSHLKIVEEFSDFKLEGKLTLPHSYKLELSFQTETRPLLADWELSLDRFGFNQSIGPDQFGPEK
jgi:outer membrane lipoprotein-sorting protein